MARKWYLVTYDVRDDGRLRRTARLLEGYGDRIQYSVFRCRLTSREVERLRWQLAVILEREDDVIIIPLCDRCSSAVVQRGPKAAPPERLHRIV